MRKTIKVIKCYSYHNRLACKYMVCIKTNFIDRLKFLIFGEECVFEIFDELEVERRKRNMENFRKTFRNVTNEKKEKDD